MDSNKFLKDSLRIVTAALALGAWLFLLTGCGSSGQSMTSQQPPPPQQSQQLAPSADPSGQLQTISLNGSVDFTNPFFKSLGTNLRTCNSCHQPADGWSISPAHLQARFNATGGTDPVFRNNDGSTCPTDDVSTVAARQTAYSLLLSKGLIRISRPIPPGAEFTLASLTDPYSCATSSDLSLYRRPLPATNLAFESTIMWDGRENVTPSDLIANLKSQAKDATLGHAQAATTPTDDQLNQIVAFELALYTAQITDVNAGPLDQLSATGGPQTLSQTSFVPGANSPYPPSPFNPENFTLYKPWASNPGSDNFTAGRAAVARGEDIFNHRQFDIFGVFGFNDVVNLPLVKGSCSTCHSTPSSGSLPVNTPMAIGIADGFRATPDIPVYNFQCNSGPRAGQIISVGDPGLALSTGKCLDIGKFKTAALRGLAGRAPYFHNGSSATLLDVVNFYNQRFTIQLTDQEKADLVAFLQTL